MASCLPTYCRRRLVDLRLRIATDPERFRPVRGQLAIFVVAALAAPSVHAQEPVLTEPAPAPSEPLVLPPVHPRVALMVGWGVPSVKDTPYALGGGLRGGVHFGTSGLYIGGTVVQYLGGHYKFDDCCGHLETSNRLGYAAFEVGYEARYKSFVFFPWGGLGVAWLASKWCRDGACVDRTKDGTGAVASTGISVYQHFGDLFVGVDGRILLATVSEWCSSDEVCAMFPGAAAFGLVGWAP
jgi:hypothetical protein